MKFRFGSNYDTYINRPAHRTIDEVELPKRYNGKVLVDFDEDAEEEIISSLSITKPSIE
jgi:hypothetical protein|tara:strand:- start:1084 stop:1260 length:177 start_codon:yes stop_codon:yes gene_type:complete